MKKFVMCLMVLILAIGAADLNAATVAHWQFEEGSPNTAASGPDSILDSSGNGLHGTPFGGPVYRQSGGSLALEFDGANDFVFINDDPLFELTRSLTIEAVIRLDALAPTQQFIVFRGDSRGGLDPYTLNITQAGKLRFQIKTAANTGASVKAPAPLPLGQFVHVAGTLNDATGEMNLYVDGELVRSKTTTVRPFGPLDPTRNPGIGIGSRQSGAADFFHGIIDEVRISDVALAIPEPSSMALCIGATVGWIGVRRLRLGRRCGRQRFSCPAAGPVIPSAKCYGTEVAESLETMAGRSSASGEKRVASG